MKELTLQDHCTWYGEQIEDCFNNGVWMFLADRQLNELKQFVKKSLKNGDNFRLMLKFKTGAGESIHSFIMEDYKG